MSDDADEIRFRSCRWNCSVSLVVVAAAGLLFAAEGCWWYSTSALASNTLAAVRVPWLAEATLEDSELDPIENYGMLETLHHYRWIDPPYLKEILVKY